MINNSGANIKLTAEQSLQLLEWQNRLGVIQDEIKIAQNKLDGLNANITTGVKHNDFLEEEVKQLETNVASLKELKAKLDEDVALSTATLTAHSHETTARHASLAEREEKAHQKEMLADTRHEHLDAREDEHNIKVSTLAEQKLAVEQAREILAKALESIKL